MPELPEVETVKRTLSELIIDETIEQVNVTWPKMIKEPDDVNQFVHLLEGQTFRSISRRGKFLVFCLDDYTLVSHLRMEGRYGVYQKEEEEAPHTHVRFTFKSGRELRYGDVRKFGTMHLFQKGEENVNRPLSQLGPEPLSSHFTSEELTQRLSRTTRAVKAALLDQSVVVGLGNIYVDEALFKARIHPEKPANSLSPGERAVLFTSVQETLNEAVKLGGSSIKSYVNGQGEMGMFQQNLRVYGRTAEPCHTCGTPIIRTIVGGRGTHTCPSCQPQFQE
ncbi:DNA-formamidopyrimidine glycosylase [Salipaludibacillus keqinensis]|uniref:Formamidopyrimidine-DNA glycosylase n=1 Tax=Salipaludibacillus keqinensis TaxID=2045207 RepID=A0A323TJF5_9BACI|nr:DNA-formamidopyrimidine glycosylase [Salipaludibacillus keqinensis]PYZ93727.1 DNA-formamidopyrimidine glycosylase [Salipaludibacillus keqinensis]